MYIISAVIEKDQTKVALYDKEYKYDDKDFEI